MLFINKYREEEKSAEDLFLKTMDKETNPDRKKVLRDWYCKFKMAMLGVEYKSKE